MRLWFGVHSLELIKVWFELLNWTLNFRYWNYDSWNFFHCVFLACLFPLISNFSFLFDLSFWLFCLHPVTWLTQNRRTLRWLVVFVRHMAPTGALKRAHCSDGRITETYHTTFLCAFPSIARSHNMRTNLICDSRISSRFTGRELRKSIRAINSISNTFPIHMGTFINHVDSWGRGPDRGDSEMTILSLKPHTIKVTT